MANIVDVNVAGDDGGGCNANQNSLRHGKLQSIHHHQNTTTQLLTGRMPFQLLNQQCQNMEGSFLF